MNSLSKLFLLTIIAIVWVLFISILVFNFLDLEVHIQINKKLSDVSLIILTPENETETEIVKEQDILAIIPKKELPESVLYEMISEIIGKDDPELIADIAQELNSCVWVVDEEAPHFKLLLSYSEIKKVLRQTDLLFIFKNNENNPQGAISLDDFIWLKNGQMYVLDPSLEEDFQGIRIFSSCITRPPISSPGCEEWTPECLKGFRGGVWVFINKQTPDESIAFVGNGSGYDIETIRETLHNIPIAL